MFSLTMYEVMLIKGHKTKLSWQVIERFLVIFNAKQMNADIFIMGEGFNWNDKKLISESMHISHYVINNT